VGLDGDDFDLGTLKDRYSTDGPGTWDQFTYCYSNHAPLFRVEVE